MERKYALAVGRDYLSPITTHVELTADVIVSKLRKFHVIPHTQAEYAAMTPHDKAVLKKQSGFLIGGNFGGRKTKADCKFRSIVALDLDALTPETAATCIEKLRLFGCRAVIYSTASHRPEKPRLRAFVFLASDVAPNDYVRLVEHFANTLPEGVISSETYKVSQLMYRPQRCSDGEELFIEIAGDPWDPTGALLAAASNPASERKSEATPAWEKPGIVGAVARIYEGDFDRAIEELKLPYVRSTAGPTCGVGEDRYSYTKGAGADGAIWYANDGHLYSHHGTDPAREVNATIFDVWRLHNADPAKDDPAAPIHERASHKAAQEWFVSRFPQLQGEVRAEAGPSELEDLGPPERPLEALERSPEPATEPAKNRFPPIAPSAFLNKIALIWLVKGLISRGAFGIVYGASGSGKSFIVWELACCITRGIPFRGHRVKKGRVLWLAAEGAGGLSARMEAYVKEHGCSLDDLPWILPYNPNLLKAEDVVDLVKSIQAWGPVDLIVGDTLSALAPGSDENAGKDMGLVMSHVLSLCRITGAATVLVHHSGKDATRGQRGWSGLKAGCDFEMEVTRNGDLRVLTHTKSKDGVDGKQYPFRLKIVSLGLDEDEDERSSCVTEEAQIEIAGPGVKLNSTQRKTFDALQAHWVNDEYDEDLLLKSVDDKFDRPLPDDASPKKVKDRKRNNQRRVKALEDLGLAHWSLDGTQIKPGKSDTEANKEYDE